MKDVIVKDSDIHGRGLFATRDFAKGETVLGWNPENKYLTEEEVEKLSDDLKPFVAIFHDKYLLIADPERYMNHSCNPNTETADDGTDYATRDIKAGEELTGSYTRVGALMGFECKCGDGDCKEVVPSDHL